jgi:RimJ/RimL family protein N-acetyltransferase
VPSLSEGPPLGSAFLHFALWETTAVQNPFLIGSTLYLRPLEKADAPTIATWLNDPEVTRYLRRFHPVSLAAEEAFLQRLSESESDIGLGMVTREGERFIGVTGLHQVDYRNRNAAFGITVGDKSAWSKGYGTEAARLLVAHAFQTLNLHRVWLHVYENNPRGQRAYEKAGFRIEGRLRQDNFREGRYWDTIVMGILREEWKP